MVKVLASIGMLLTYTAAISAANTPRWADNGTKTAPHRSDRHDGIRQHQVVGKPDAVTVVAKKPPVKSELDKMTYDVESDPEAQANSVLEMLRKVPMVTVDGQDNIMVNNSSSFKVYVNGKPNNMMSNNPSEVLKNMPANSVKKIEIITNPGPKYDAEGVGGIINIITTGKGMEGYSLTVGTNYNTWGPHRCQHVWHRTEWQVHRQRTLQLYAQRCEALLGRQPSRGDRRHRRDISQCGELFHKQWLVQLPFWQFRGQL